MLPLPTLHCQESPRGDPCLGGQQCGTPLTHASAVFLHPKVEVKRRPPPENDSDTPEEPTGANAQWADRKGPSSVPSDQGGDILSVVGFILLQLFQEPTRVGIHHGLGLHPEHPDSKSRHRPAPLKARQQPPSLPRRIARKSSVQSEWAAARVVPTRAAPRRPRLFARPPNGSTR